MSVELKNTTLRFGEQAILENFSLNLPDKGVICLFGPSGSGKTTLLHLIAGLIHPDAGMVDTHGGRISVVFQEDRLLPWISMKANIDVAGGESQKWIERMGLEGADDKYPGELSGGMRRRAAIARALSYGGDILLLDEPFKGLDAALKAQVMNAVFEQERLVVFVTHDMTEALGAADEIVVLEGPPVRITHRLKLDEPRHKRNIAALEAAYGEVLGTLEKEL